MTSASKAKGSSFEREVVMYLRDNGFPFAERALAGATDDIGDIIGTPNCVWECKNHKRMDLAGWMNELDIEIANQVNRYKTNGPAVVGAVVHKKRGTTSAGQYYATMPLSQYVYLLKGAGY